MNNANKATAHKDHDIVVTFRSGLTVQKTADRYQVTTGHVERALRCEMNRVK